MDYSYKWKLKETDFKKDQGKVFSCFSCGGGSTMGYKLAGFDVVGCNEIDPKMMECYKTNHNPKYSFLEPIQGFIKRKDFPEELYDLDILDGSPPCSSFSMAGNREEDWGKEKKFREGQQSQVLDTLFFDFIELADILKPKIVIAENVKGLLMGDARVYLARILEAFESCGYKVTYKVLDASKMGVPQKRERVFFFAIREDLADRIEYEDMFQIEPHIDLTFNEKRILFKDIMDMNGRELSDGMRDVWEYREHGDKTMQAGSERLDGRSMYFSQSYLYHNKVANTLTSHEDSLVLFDAPKYTSREEACQLGTFPLDYDFCGSKPHYVIGMSVPPVMMAHIATKVKDEWIRRIK